MVAWASQHIVAAALSGDEVAVEALIAAVWERCFRLAASALCDRALAQDAAQEACVVLHRKVHTLRTAAAFDAWMYRVTMREAGKVRRRSAPLRPREPLREMATDEVMAIDVWSALGALPGDMRDVVVLFYFDDLATSDIAGVLGVADATVRTRLWRARELLRGVLGDYASSAVRQRREGDAHVQ